VYSNKRGEIEIRVKLNGDEVLGGLQEEKTDLTGVLPSQAKILLKKFFSLIKNKIFNDFKVNAQQGTIKTLQLEPIPSSLSGYAYDASGKVIANADVSIYTKSPYKLYCQTKADSKGYFRIGTNCLPPVPYTIVYSFSGGNQVKISTTQFINQNSNYLATNKVNLNIVVDNKGQPVKIVTKTPSRYPSPTQTLNNPQNNLIFIAIVLLVLLMGVIALIGVYIYRRNKEPPSF